MIQTISALFLHISWYILENIKSTLHISFIAESTSVRHGYIFHCNISSSSSSSSSSSRIVDLKLSYISWRQVTPLVLNMKTTCCEQNVVFIIHTLKKKSSFSFNCVYGGSDWCKTVVPCLSEWTLVRHLLSMSFTNSDRTIIKSTFLHMYWSLYESLGAIQLSRDMILAFSRPPLHPFVIKWYFA